MCGIAGILALSDKFAITKELEHAVSVCLAHRGPDGAGAWRHIPDETTPRTPAVSLLHRRLAILDPDPRANQPFTRHLQTIVFNGEIYNFRDIRPDLTDPEIPWRTSGDTEVLLAACAKWDNAALEKLSGMFAFAIWDQATQTLFAARDRMGQKPFYYSYAPGKFFAFASEPGPLLQIPWIDREIDDTGLAEYLAFGFNPTHTVYKHIHRLPPGHWLQLRSGELRIERYFHPNTPSVSRIDESSAVSRTRELLQSAVRQQLISDVPLGCFLSGGIDSSVIALCMRRAIGRDTPLQTFTIGFEDARYDESSYAAEVAKHLHTQHHHFLVRPDAAEDLPSLAAGFGEPFGDSSALPTQYLSRETRQHIKVALSGDGGDELFAGYDRYRAMLLGARLKPFAPILGPLSRLFPGTHPKSRAVRARRLARTLYLPPGERYAEYLRLDGNPDARQYLSGKPTPDNPIFSLVRRFDELHAAGRDLLESAAALDREIYLPEDLLVKLDRCSMLYALEVRSPFMDHNIVHFAATLPSSLLMKSGPKHLLRRAFSADLPASVFRRRKMGFAIPIGEWFRSSLRAMIQDLLLAKDAFIASRIPAAEIRKLLNDHHQKRADHSQALYAILMLELWARNKVG